MHDIHRVLRCAAVGAALWAWNLSAGAVPGAAQATVGVGAASSCIAVATPCVTVPVTIAHGASPAIRATSVRIQLSADLQLCGAIATGGYLPNESMQIIDHGGGAYTVDEATLGTGCTASGNGTLFTLQLASSSPTGTGTVTITNLLVRDCANQPVPAVIGAAGSVPIDQVAPTAIASLGAAQDKVGNDGDGTTVVDVSWPSVEAGATVEVYRAGFGNYPEYDDAPGSGSVPATPSYPPGAPWTLAGSVSGVTTLADEVGTRDFWYYVAFVKDGCGNVSLVSNQSGGTLNYHLGDVHNTVANCAGDNQVSTPDISYLGGNYGALLGPLDARACLDVGPTTDFSVNARPTTDNQIQFEDLVMFAINYASVSKAPVAGHIAAASVDELMVSAPAMVGLGEEFTAVVRMKGTGMVQGLSAALAWDETIAEPLGVSAGGWLEGLNGVAFTPEHGVVDAAVLGTGVGLRGEGELAVVRFRARAAGAPGIAVARVEARDASNRQVLVGGVAGRPEVVSPARTALGIAAPNPFAGSTTVSLSLARSGKVRLAAYDLTGRRVRTLVEGEMSAGSRTITWDGRTDGGAKVAPGSYVLRLEAGEIVQARQVRIVR